MNSSRVYKHFGMRNGCCVTRLYLMHGSRVYKHFGMRTAAVIITLLNLMHGIRVYKLFGMGNGCRENSRFVSDEFRRSCI